MAAELDIIDVRRRTDFEHKDQFMLTAIHAYGTYRVDYGDSLLNTRLRRQTAEWPSI